MDLRLGLGLAELELSLGWNRCLVEQRRQGWGQAAVEVLRAGLVPGPAGVGAEGGFEVGAELKLVWEWP